MTYNNILNDRERASCDALPKNRSDELELHAFFGYPSPGTVCWAPDSVKELTPENLSILMTFGYFHQFCLGPNYYRIIDITKNYITKAPDFAFPETFTNAEDAAAIEIWMNFDYAVFKKRFQELDEKWKDAKKLSTLQIIELICEITDIVYRSFFDLRDPSNRYVNNLNRGGLG